MEKIFKDMMSTTNKVQIDNTIQMQGKEKKRKVNTMIKGVVVACISVAIRISMILYFIASELGTRTNQWDMNTSTYDHTFVRINDTSAPRKPQDGYKCHQWPQEI